MKDQQTKHEIRCENLKNYSGEYEIMVSTVMAKELENRKNDTTVMSVNSGIPKLDELIKGFRGGELTVISGKTKHGKTLLAQTFTRNMNEIIMPMWFTYELPIAQFLQQFGTHIPLFLIPRTLRQNDLIWLEDRILEGILKYDCKVVFLDNTHNMLNLALENLTHRIDEFVKFIKEIAIKNNIHFFLLHHISKSDIHHPRDISSDLLRDSSMIPQTADNVFFIWRDADGAWLKITENRREGVFNKSIRLQKVGNFFEEVIDMPVEDLNPKPRKRRKDQYGDD